MDTMDRKEKLIEAIDEENAEEVEAALAAGADPQAVDEDDWPLLVRAALEGDPDIVELLLNVGAPQTSPTPMERRR